MDKPDVVENLFGVYLLYSLNEKYLGRTYIGYTVNPIRRINQHNKGCLAGGARKTSNRGPWKMVLIVYGFPNNIAALRFEWAWQNPDGSRRLYHVLNKKRLARKESQIQFNIRILSEMLCVGPWKRLPLTIRWLEMEFHQDFLPGKFPPMHMPICYGPVNTKVSVLSIKSTVAIEDHNKINTDVCKLCRKFLSNSKITCLNTKCNFISHMSCLADLFLENGEYVPIEGQCPDCNLKLLWGDLLRKMKGYNDNYINDDDNDSVQMSQSSFYDGSDSDKSNCSILSG